MLASIIIGSRDWIALAAALGAFAGLIIVARYSAAFLDRRIGFLDIAGVVEQVMGEFGAPAADTLEDVLALDAMARAAAARFCAARAKTAA